MAVTTDTRMLLHQLTIPFDLFIKSSVIKKEDGKYKLYTKDGKRVLGTHATRQGAIKQEYAIEKSQEKRATISGDTHDLSELPIQRFDHGPRQPALPAIKNPYTQSSAPTPPIRTIQAQPLTQQYRQDLFQTVPSTPAPSEVKPEPKQPSPDRFTAATERLFVREGYGKPVTDSGGYTRWGISRKSWPNEDIENMTRERATEIYRDHYWPNELEEFPAIQEKMFDLKVNFGPRTHQWLQQAILDAGGDLGRHGVDGHIGDNTLAGLRMADRDKVMEALINKQRDDYNRLREANPKKYGNTRGWDDRLKFDPREFYK